MWLATPATADDAVVQRGRVSEYDVKALVLLNLIRYTEWPARSFPSDKAPYVVCVVGADPFGASLSVFDSPEEFNGRRFRIERVGEDGPTTGCHLAFITSSDPARVQAVLASTAEKPVLTVSDTAGFLRAGGMVMLFTEGSRVRFTINPFFVHRGGLRMSSQLLQLSRTLPGMPMRPMPPPIPKERP